MGITEFPNGSDVARNAVREAIRAAGVGIVVKLDGTRVILYGIADSSGARIRAEKLARAVPGVTEVTNYLLVKEPAPALRNAQPDAARLADLGVLTR